MKRVLILLFMLASFGASAQYGGEIRAKGYAPDDTLKTIMRKDRALRTYDTTTMAQIVLLRDTTSWKKSIKISEMPSITATVSGTVTVDSNTQRITHKISQLPQVPTMAKLLATYEPETPVGATGTLDTLTMTSDGMLQTYDYYGNQYLSQITGNNPRFISDPITGNNAKVEDSRALKVADSNVKYRLESIYSYMQDTTVAGVKRSIKVSELPIVSIDSNTTRSTIKISSMPAISVDSTTGSRITHKISESVLPSGAATQATLSALNDKIPTLGTASSRLLVDGSGVTQPVSGTFYQATQPVSLASVPSHEVTNGGTFVVQLDSTSQRITHKISQLPTVSIDSSTTRNTVKVLNTVTTSLDSATQRSSVKVSQLPSIALGANSGVDIGDVTINNASGASAVNIQDGGNTITVDGTVGISGTVTVGSHAVTNAGTFAVQVDSSTQRNTMKVLNTVTTSLDSSTQRSAIKISSMPSVTVDSTTASRITHKISESVLPIGASTAAKQPSLGTAGTASSDVITVQGIASMTALKVDGSAVTQPVSGTFYQATQPVSLASVPSHAVTNAGTFAVQVDSSTQRQSIKIKEQIPLVAGTAYIGKTRLTDGTTDAEVVPLAGYNGQAVAIVDGSGNQITSFGGGTQYAENSTTDPATGTASLMRYESTDPTLTNGQMSMPNLTAKAELRVKQNNGTMITDVISTNPDNILIPCEGYSSISLWLQQPGGGYNITTNIQYSNDNANFLANTSNLILTNVGTDVQTANIPSTSGTGNYILNTKGFNYVRIIVTAWVSGSFTVYAVPNNSNQIQPVSLASVPSHAVTNAGTFSVQVTSVQQGSTNGWVGEDNASGGAHVGAKLLDVRTDALTSSVDANLDYILTSATKYGSRLVKDEERHKVTYTASFKVTVAASCTDFFEIKGSASKLVIIDKIKIRGTQTTSGTVDVYVKKRSTANTGGTSSATTNVPHISTDAAATAVGSIYTVNPTTGADVGNLQVVPIFVSATTAQPENYTIDFGERSKPVSLSGTAQTLALNLNSVTVTGGVFYISVTWTEE
jgi:hypothetical protein